MFRAGGRLRLSPCVCSRYVFGPYIASTWKTRTRPSTATTTMRRTAKHKHAPIKPCQPSSRQALTETRAYSHILWILFGGMHVARNAEQPSREFIAHMESRAVQTVSRCCLFGSNMCARCLVFVCVCVCVFVAAKCITQVEPTRTKSNGISFHSYVRTQQLCDTHQTCHS